MRGIFSFIFLLLVVIRSNESQFGRILYGTREEIWSNPGYSLESPGEHFKKIDVEPEILIQLVCIEQQVVLVCSHWLLKPLVKYELAQVFERVRTCGFRTEDLHKQCPLLFANCFCRHISFDLLISPTR